MQISLRIFIWCPCISMRDTWQRNPISQWCLVAPDSGWLLGARQRPLRAGEMAPLGIALHIQPLIWPGQGKVLCQQTRQGRFYSLVLTLMLLTLLHSQRRQLSVSDWHQLTQHMQNCYYLSSMQNIYRGNLRIFSKSAKKKRRKKERRTRFSLYLPVHARAIIHFETCRLYFFQHIHMVLPQNGTIYTHQPLY